MPNFRSKYNLININIFIFNFCKDISNIKIFKYFINIFYNLLIFFYNLDIGFKNGQFSRIIKIVSSIWQKFQKDRASINILVAHLRLYKEKKYPYDAPYIQGYDIPTIWWSSIEPEPNYLQELALKILSIVPNSASCERNFSLLNWLTGNKRIQLDVQKLETIAKLCTYYNSNAKKELSYFASKMSEEELIEILNQTYTKTFEKVLEKEGINKELLSINNLELFSSADPSTETSTITKDNLVLFLETSLDLNDEIFIDDLEKFPDNDDDYDSLFENENLNNNENELILGKDEYSWDSEELINSDDN
jgi:hypothetical protein